MGLPDHLSFPVVKPMAVNSLDCDRDSLSLFAKSVLICWWDLPAKDTDCSGASEVTSSRTPCTGGRGATQTWMSPTSRRMRRTPGGDHDGGGDGWRGGGGGRIRD